MDNLDEYLAATPENEAAPAEVAPEAQAEQPAEQPEAEAKPERVRGPDGKFAKKEEPVMVPLQALHETRDEVKALKAELERFRQPQPQQQQVPDIFENPEGFVQYQNAQLQMATLNTTLNLSESMAKRYAGAETVEEAKAWGMQEFSRNPALYQQFIQQPDPYGFLIDQHKRATLLAEFEADPSQIEAFRDWQKAQANPQPAQPAPVVPTTLADAQSARGSTEAFKVPTLDEILKR